MQSYSFEGSSQKKLSPCLWLPTSNVWDDNDETFVIEKFDGFRKKGVDGAKKDQFHVIWEPRIFAADLDFPDELPEVKGLPWDECDEDWVSATDYMREYKKNKVENAEIIQQLELLKIGGTGGVVVGGLE